MRLAFALAALLIATPSLAYTGYFGGGGGGTITSVGSACASGACDSISIADAQKIDLSAVTVSSATEGLFLPKATDCSSATAEGQVCWESDADHLWVGDGAAAKQIDGAGSGDITDVGNCATGAAFGGACGTTLTSSGALDLDVTGATDINANGRLDVWPGRGAPASDNITSLNISPSFTDSNDVTYQYLTIAPTVTASANSAKYREYIHLGGTYTVGSTTWNAPIFGIEAVPEVIADSNLESIPTMYLFANDTTFTWKSTNVGGQAIYSFWDSPILRANTTGTTLATNPSIFSYVSAPLLQSGTSGVTLTLDDRVGFDAHDVTPTATGTLNLTRNVGFHCDDFGGASGNYTPSARYCFYSNFGAGTGKRFLFNSGLASSVLVGPLSVGTDQEPTATLHVEEPTVGNPVLILESTATGDDPKETTYEGRCTTTGAATCTLKTLAIASGRAYLLDGKAVGHCTGGTSCTADQSWAYVDQRAFKNSGGTVACVPSGCTALVNQDAEDIGAAFDCTMTISGTDVIYTCTGAANYNVTWHAILRVQDVGS